MKNNFEILTILKNITFTVQIFGTYIFNLNFIFQKYKS